MDIKQKDVGEDGIFYIEENGDRLAEMVYSNSPGKITILHTEVDQKLRGKNIGLQLVHKAIAYAREKKLKIVPLCTFTRSVFNKTSEFNDVLA